MYEEGGFREEEWLRTMVGDCCCEAAVAIARRYDRNVCLFDRANPEIMCMFAATECDALQQRTDNDAPVRFAAARLRDQLVQLVTADNVC